jgi:hypothetical protein
MKKGIFSLIAISLLVVIFASQAVAQSPLEVTATVVEKTTNVNSVVNYDFVVKNNQDVIDNVIVSISGLHLEWMSVDKYFMRINPFSSRSLELSFYPKNPGDFEYEVTVFSLDSPERKNSIGVLLHVLPEKEIELKDFSVTKSGDKLNLDLSIKIIKKRQLTVDFVVKDPNGNEIRSSSIPAEVEGTTNVLDTMDLPDLLAGTYTVTASVAGTDESTQTTFTVQAIKNVAEARKSVKTTLSEDVKITITNDGNVIESGYVLKQSLPAGQSVTWIDKPTREHTESGITTYEWVLPTLKPKQSMTISYRIEYWPVIAAEIVVIIIILAIIFYLFLKFTSPGIKKLYIRKGKGEHSIILEIKGSFFHELKDVLVSDTISPLARVQVGSETTKPVMKEYDAGTQLIWKFGNIKPKSELVVSYRIKSVLEVGSMRMPRAVMRFRINDKKYSVFSKELTIY